MTYTDRKIGFVGVGNMASAMILGLTGVGKIPHANLFLFDLIADKTDEFKNKGSNVVGSIAELTELCDCIVLSVKPQNYNDVLTALAASKPSKRILYISIAAGIETQCVSYALGGVPVVRALPNTPMLIGKGVTALCRNAAVTDDEFDFACSIFETAGSIIKIDESEMNRVISVTSSSPAYVFMFIKSICEGACAQGLELKETEKIVCDMVRGAAELLASSDKSVDELISMVCSKGGTTERAVAELERLGFSKAVVSAMKKCTDRANELGKQ